MNLGLGTAQFGMDYGVSNRVGQTPPQDVAAILARALDAGIRVIDTAAAYGSAERVLGEFGMLDRFDVVTKTPALRSEPGAARADILERTLLDSLSKLRLSSVYGLLLHSSGDLLGEQNAAVARRLVALRDQGLVTKIGVSIYSRAELDRMAEVLSPDIVQLPLSVYDQRMLADGTIEMLHAAGVEVHTRSALLQGVLAMQPEDLPGNLDALRAHHARYRSFVASIGLEPVAAAIGFVLGIEQVSAAVVGVNTLAQLEELLAVAPLAPEAFAEWAVDDEALVNPSLWGTR